jgi:hypothetical protein
MTKATIGGHMRLKLSGDHCSRSLGPKKQLLGPKKHCLGPNRPLWLDGGAGDMHSERKPTAYSYARFSTPEQAKGDSSVRQTFMFPAEGHRRADEPREIVFLTCRFDWDANTNTEAT